MNGEPFERQTYACGHEIRWSPNFRRQEVVNLCPNSKEQLAIRDKRKKASSALSVFINTLDVDTPWKERFISALPRTDS